MNAATPLPLPLQKPLRFRGIAALMTAGLISLWMAITCTGVSAQPLDAVSPLITPQALKVLIDKKANLLILDIRELMQGDGKTPNYDAGHIPGAIPAPYSSIRGPEKNPGEVLSDREFTRLFQGWGVTPDAHIIIAPVGSDASDFGGAARLFWTFHLAGLKRVSILEGGLGAWGALGYPLETKKSPITPSKIIIKLDRSQIVTTRDIEQLLKSKTNNAKKFVLNDSRPEDYFLGEDKHSSAPRAGTLPGAKHLDHEEWFQINTSRLQPKAQLESIAKGAGLIGDDDVITFCNTGHWSATTWFVMTQLLGKQNVRLYPESTVGWSKSRNPMDNEPSRASVLKQQLKDSIDNLKK